MSDRPTINLPYGAGLDRATGVSVIEPTKFADLRNIILEEGKAEVRKGHVQVGVLKDEANADLDAVCALHPIRQLQQGLGVGYRSSDRTVHVNRLTGAGVFAQYIDDWFTAAAGTGTPRIIPADQGPRVFLAHDEPIYARRAMTIYYENDALFGLGPLNPDGGSNGDVETDLDGDETNDQIKFRGVVNHLKYLAGWGFGTATDPDLNHVLRVCFPGESLRWRGDDYFLVGSPGVPIVTARPCGDGLAVFKEYERHHIFGYDRSSFGIVIAEPFIGCASSRLAVTVSGACYFWSLEGPKVATGRAPSVDLALPLDLKGPEPADLVAAGEAEDGFAEYVPDLKCVLFVFGRRIYCLSLRNPLNPRWSYWELPTPAACSGILYTGGVTGSGDPPTAYVSALAGVAGP